MYAKFLLAGLAATAVSASPLIARQQAPPTASSAAAAPSSTGVLVTPPANQALIEKLELAATSVDRFTILAAEDPAHLKFDFNLAANPPANASGPPPAGGQVVVANRKNFPAVIDLGISNAVGFMNPCGLNTPHTHPRATEFLTLVEGDSLRTGFILENGFTLQQSTLLSKFQGTVFPMGSIHFQLNDNCKPAVFVAGLNSEDPGASSIANNFFAIDADIVDATLGFPKQIDQNNFAQFKANIPAPFANGIEACLKRCNIKY